VSRLVDDRLKQVPLFSECRRKDLSFISAIMRERSFPAGTALTTEGESGDEFMIIMDGTATVRRNGRRVSHLGPGDFFGEISLLDPGPRTATIVADTPITVKVFGRREWASLLAERGVCAQLLRALARRLRDAEPKAL
jgi:CRP/FNR family transcriptional regulator, cyclic AMP receptor protein